MNMDKNQHKHHQISNSLDEEEVDISQVSTELTSLQFTENGDLEIEDEEVPDEYKDLKENFPVLYELVDFETGKISYNRLWDKPGHLGNMIMVGGSDKDRQLNEDGYENQNIRLIGPDCKISKI